MTDIATASGKSLFGHDPSAYQAVRPDYPAELFELLAEIDPGPVLELGPGVGTATRQLLSLGFKPLLALEPDERFSPLLNQLAAGFPGDLEVKAEAFEEARLAAGSFELIVSATAFHWLDPATRAARLRELLRPAGHVALFWHVFQILGRADPFHTATAEYLRPLHHSPSGAPDAIPFALQQDVRQHEFESAGFQSRGFVEKRWSLALNPAEIRQLYGTFSGLQQLMPDARERLLDKLEQVAQTQFDGRVVRNMTSVGYLFQKSATA